MPVYVELGLDPKHMMFYSKNVERPIHVGYYRPTFAGVLTGFNAKDPKNEYWNVFIRRHDNVAREKTPSPYNNLVRVDMDQDLNTPFAGINAKAYVMGLNSEDATVSPTGTPTSSPTTDPKPGEPSTTIIVKVTNTTATTVEGLKDLINQLTAGYTPEDKAGIQSIVLDNDSVDFDSFLDDEIVLGDILRDLGINTDLTVTLICKDTDTCGGKISDLYDFNPIIMDKNAKRRLMEVASRRLADVTLLKIDGKKAKKITYGKNTMPKKEQFIIVNCANLETLIVQAGAFANTVGFYLDNNPMLKSVFMEKNSFSGRAGYKGILVWDRKVWMVLFMYRASCFELCVLWL